MQTNTMIAQVIVQHVIAYLLTEYHWTYSALDHVRDVIHSLSDVLIVHLYAKMAELVWIQQMVN